MNEPSTHRSGQALAEFAIVLPVLLLLVMGLFDFGRAVFAYNAVSSASRAAIRVAIVDQSPVAVEAKAIAQTIGMDPDEVVVDLSSLTTSCPTVKIGCATTVAVEYSWRPIFPLFQLMWPDGIGLSSTTSMPIERVYVSP